MRLDEVWSNCLLAPWLDLEDATNGKNLDVHGNPNVLTLDIGTSSLGQGCSAHSCLVDIELFTDPLPDIKIFSQPDIKSA